MINKVKTIAALVAVAGGAATQAADIAQIISESTLTPNGAILRSITQGSSSIPDLVEQLINREGAFAAYGNDPFISAALNAMGVPHVINLDIQDQTAFGGGVVVNLTSALTGLNHTITGATRAEAEDNVREYLEENGADELAKILKALGKASPIAVTTGNPNSSAALTAQSVFDQYGFIETRTNAEAEEGLPSGYEVSVTGDVGLIEAKGFKARSYSLPIAFSVLERERWALRMALPINYTEIEGAEIYRAGLNLSLPIMVIGSTAEHKTPWYWQLTPSGGTQATFSEDLVAGGLLNNAGLTSALEYNLGTNFHNIRISMGNQITFIESMELSVSQYTFDPNVSAQIVKNGLKIGIPLGRNWLFDVYFIDTRFFGDGAYSDGYETVGGSLGYRKSRKGGFYKLGTYANLSKDYSSANVHFGAGWAF